MRHRASGSCLVDWSRSQVVWIECWGQSQREGVGVLMKRMSAGERSWGLKQRGIWVMRMVMESLWFFFVFFTKSSSSSSTPAIPFLASPTPNVFTPTSQSTHINHISPQPDPTDRHLHQQRQFIIFIINNNQLLIDIDNNTVPALWNIVVSFLSFPSLGENIVLLILNGRHSVRPISGQDFITDNPTPTNRANFTSNRLVHTTTKWPQSYTVHPFVHNDLLASHTVQKWVNICSPLYFGFSLSPRSLLVYTNLSHWSGIVHPYVASYSARYRQ